MDYRRILTLTPTACIRDTGIPVDEVLQQLKSGKSEADICSLHQALRPDDIAACVAFGEAREKSIHIFDQYDLSWSRLWIDEDLLTEHEYIRVSCPKCGEDLRKKPGDPPPRCDTCKAPMNEEGLLVELEQTHSGSGKYRPIISQKVREVGRGGRVIWQYFLLQNSTTRLDPWDQVIPLLENIRDLQSEASKKSVDLKHGSDVAWNLKRARHRFKRAFEEAERRPIEIRDSELSKIASQVIKDKALFDRLDQDDMDDLLSKRYTIDNEARWRAITKYEERKREEPFFLFKSLPVELSKIFFEAQQAWRWSLGLAVLALCRTALEVALSFVLTAAEKAPLDSPFHKWAEEVTRDNTKDNLCRMIDRLPSEFADLKDLAHKVRKAGNDALHEASLESDAEVHNILRITFNLARICAFLERDARISTL